MQASNTDLQDKNADLQATMEATTEVMLQLLAEPQGGAPSAAPAASVVTRAEFCGGRLLCLLPCTMPW